MDGWMIALLSFGALLLAARLIVGPAAPANPSRREEHPPAEAADEEPLWTPDALSRLGTPETVQDLVAQGRTDELRGLGYEGELPP